MLRSSSRVRASGALVACLALAPVPAPVAQSPAPPAARRDQARSAEPAVRLVLLIAVDQFRQDYLTRFGPPTAGLRTLMTRGAVFTDAHLEHGVTVTAVGHATMLSGATPSVSGIIDNAWYERSTRSNVESITDTAAAIVGGDSAAGVGASPRRLLVPTLGDQIKLASAAPKDSEAAPRVIGLSLKDRSAILPSGHAADGAYFFRGGRFVTTSYYHPALPAWVEEVNARRLPESYAGKRWDYVGGTRPYPTEVGAKLYSAVIASPAGNELVLALAKAALEHERLGQRGVTDVLTVSFSSNDSVGHPHGPESPEVRDITRQTDRQIQQLLDDVDKRVGLARTLVAFTTDHGVAPLPEAAIALRLPAGRFKSQPVADAIEAALDGTFGDETWIERIQLPHVYLDLARLTARKVDPAEARRVAAGAVATVPHVSRVYTRDAILSGQVPVDSISTRVTRGFHRDRSGDLHVVLDPLWTTAGTGTSHGTPYSYDAHIPLILMGPGVTAGTYHQHAALNDLAPTLAALIGVEAPSGSSGRILHEALSARLPGPRPAPGASAAPGTTATPGSDGRSSSRLVAP